MAFGIWVVELIGGFAMGFSDVVGNISSTASGVADKAKSISEVNNLKRKMAYEEERIIEIFADIGKSLYENRNQDIKAFQPLCDDIDTRKRRIKKMRLELNEMRGIKLCETCGMEVNEKFVYCGNCGAKLPSSRDIVVSDSNSNEDITNLFKSSGVDIATE